MHMLLNINTFRQFILNCLYFCDIINTGRFANSGPQVFSGGYKIFKFFYKSTRYIIEKAVSYKFTLNNRIIFKIVWNKNN